MTEPTLIVKRRPDAKRVWLIKRGNETIRLTEEQIDFVTEAVEDANSFVKESWRLDADGSRHHSEAPYND